MGVYAVRIVLGIAGKGVRTRRVAANGHLIVGSRAGIATCKGHNCLDRPGVSSSAPSMGQMEVVRRQQVEAVMLEGKAGMR